MGHLCRDVPIVEVAALQVRERVLQKELDTWIKVKARHRLQPCIGTYLRFVHSKVTLPYDRLYNLNNSWMIMHR